MPGRQLRTVLHFLRQVSDFSSASQQSDGQLLRRFIDRRDAAAFTVLVQRHGPLVLSVCRRVLPNLQDAEDAFQATFLVLVRKARSIARQESVGSWLHGVARRIAVRAKSDIARRRACEQQAARLPPPDTLHEVVWRDLREMIDEEVLRLPARCREPFVLCYMEGRTNEEAAHLLGCPKGTVQSRLARARELLRARLARRGLVVSAGLVATLLPSGAASAVVPAALVGAVVTAARLDATGRVLAAGGVSSKVILLAEGVLQAMFLTKLKLAALVLAAVGVTGLAGGLAAGHLLRPGKANAVEGGQPQKPAGESKDATQPGPAADPKEPPAAERDRAETAIFKLQHVPATQFQRVFADIVGVRGAVGINDRTNSVIVRASAQDLAAFRMIIKAIDVPAKPLPDQPILRRYALKHVTAEQAKTLLEKLYGQAAGLKLAVTGPDSLFVWAVPAMHEDIAALIDRLQTTTEKKPQQSPVLDLAAAGSPPVAAGAPLDLVNLASAYIEAVRSLELARLRVERVEKLKGAISNEEAAIARIDLQAAERKVALFRSIAEAAYQGAQSELAAVKSRHEVGQALANQVAAAEAKVKMLKSILDSAK